MKVQLRFEGVVEVVEVVEVLWNTLEIYVDQVEIVVVILNITTTIKITLTLFWIIHLQEREISKTCRWLDSLKYL